MTEGPGRVRWRLATATSLGVMAATMAGCPPGQLEPERPASGADSPTSSATRESTGAASHAVSTAGPEPTASPSDGGASNAAPDVPPPCPPPDPLAPVSFVSMHRTDRPTFEIVGLQFATPDPSLAPSLLQVQAAVDRSIDERVHWLVTEAGWPDPEQCGPGGCLANIDCEVTRNDGEFLAVVCTAFPPRFGDSWSVVARRKGNRFAVIDVGELLPKADDDAAVLLSRECTDRGQQGDDGMGLGWWSPLTTTLRLHFSSSHPSGGNCWMPIASIHPWHGCSTLTSAVAGADSDATAPADVPLSFALGPRAGFNPYSDWALFWSRYAVRAPLAQSLRRGVDDWLAALAAAEGAGKEPAGWCRVYSSTTSVVSAVCGSGGRNIPGGGLAFRVRDGQRIQIGDLLGARSDSLRRIATRCLGRFVGKRIGDFRLDALPTLTPRDLETFGLMQNAVSFRLVWTFEGSELPQSIGCVVPYGELGTSLALLAKPR